MSHHHIMPSPEMCWDAALLASEVAATAALRAELPGRPHLAEGQGRPAHQIHQQISTHHVEIEQGGGGGVLLPEASSSKEPLQAQEATCLQNSSQKRTLCSAKLRFRVLLILLPQIRHLGVSQIPCVWGNGGGHEGHGVDAQAQAAAGLIFALRALLARLFASLFWRLKLLKTAGPGLLRLKQEKNQLRFLVLLKTPVVDSSVI